MVFVSASHESPATKRRNLIANVRRLPEHYGSGSENNENMRPRHDGLQRRRRRWGPAEIQALEEGLEKYGRTAYADILRDHNGSPGSLDDVLRYRTQVNLKDKARNEKLKRLKLGLDLGPWAHAWGELLDDVDTSKD